MNILRMFGIGRQTDAEKRREIKQIKDKLKAAEKVNAHYELRLQVPDLVRRLEELEPSQPKPVEPQPPKSSTDQTPKE